MTAKKIQTATLSRSEFGSYRDKAMQHYNVMKFCLGDRDWDTLMVTGVHAVISMTDAITTAKLGQRSTAQAHRDVMDLLRQVVGLTENGNKNIMRLGEILDWKHAAEYEPRRCTEKEAKQFAQSVERYIEWAQKQLPLTS